jgi:5'-nucleotidase
VEEGFISVTPLHLDLTHYNVLEAASTWWRDL